MKGLATRLGCTDAACQLFQGDLQVCSTECDLLSSGVMYSSARCCATTLVLVTKLLIVRSLAK